ncbi:unnamed protein product [Scytosiphon promiscuus]
MLVALGYFKKNKLTTLKEYLLRHFTVPEGFRPFLRAWLLFLFSVVVLMMVVGALMLLSLLLSLVPAYHTNSDWHVFPVLLACPCCCRRYGRFRCSRVDDPIEPLFSPAHASWANGCVSFPFFSDGPSRAVTRAEGVIIHSAQISMPSTVQTRRETLSFYPSHFLFFASPYVAPPPPPLPRRCIFLPLTFPALAPRPPVPLCPFVCVGLRYALFFLVRSAPEEMLCLQNGRFDDPDRSFISVKGAWDSVLNNHADLKELIPEFYAGDGSFLTNADDLQLGVTQGGHRVGDVELPPWARNPRDFVRKMRRALESPHVSRQLHLWIDLVFGYLQRGKAAIEADNLFYHLTYEGTVDLEAIDDPRERAALESQISEFGQCPSLLFAGPHPRREDLLAPVALAPSIKQQQQSSCALAKPLRHAAQAYKVHTAPVQRSCPSSSNLLDARTTVTAKIVVARRGEANPAAQDGGVDEPLHAQQRRSGLRGATGAVSSPPSPPLAASPVALAVSDSVGALWKRGLAMAGVVGGAAAEATAGVRGLQQRWPATAGAASGGWAGGGGKGGAAERRPRQSSAEGAGLSAASRSGPASGGGGGEGFDIDGGLLDRGRSNSTSMGRPGSFTSSSSLREGGGVGLDDSQPAFDAVGNRDESARGGVFAAPEFPASLEGGVYGMGGDGRLAPAPPLPVLVSSPSVPVAITAAAGSARWHLDPATVDLRPGEPMALHRDGVTCAHLVRTAGGAATGVGRAAGSAAAEEVDQVTLCTSSKDGSLKICALEREAGGSGPVSKAHTRRRVAGGEMALSCCALTADGKHALAGSWNNSILVYSVEAACVLSRVEGAHEDGVSCLALHEEPLTRSGGGSISSSTRQISDTRRKMVVATGSWDAAVKVWEIWPSDMNPIPVLELFDLETPVQALAIDGAGKALAAGGEDGMVAVWDLATGGLSATFSACGDQSPIVAIRWAWSLGDGKACLVLASAGGDVYRVSPVGVSLGSLRLDSEVVAMDSDGRCTVVACRDGSLRLLASLDDGGFVQTAVRESGHEADITCLHVCADGDGGASVDDSANAGLASKGNAAVILTGSEGGAVRVWDVVRRRCRA